MKFAHIVALLSLLLLPFAAAAQDKSADDIMEEVTKRHSRPYEFEITRVTLSDKTGVHEIRDMKRYQRAVGPGEFRFLMVWHAPPGIRGAAMITWASATRKDGRWIFLPARAKKATRIVKGAGKNFIMGMDYAAEDLMPENKDDVIYTRGDDAMINGERHYVIDVEPDDPEFRKTTGYGRRRHWIRQDNYFIMRTDFFDKRGKLIKRETASDVINVEEDLWRASSKTMENFEADHSTRIDVLERKFDEESVPTKIFFERYLISGDHLR